MLAMQWMGKDSTRRDSRMLDICIEIIQDKDDGWRWQYHHFIGETTTSAYSGTLWLGDKTCHTFSEALLKALAYLEEDNGGQLPFFSLTVQTNDLQRQTYE
jgi:hypothetical protein